MDIPVYLVAGFLDSGKTSFINGILEDGFAREDRTLLICCEEGDSLKAYKNRDWVDITATVKKEHLDAYEGEGPVLYVERITTTSKPAQEVVSF